MIEVFRNSSEYITHAVYFSGTPVEVDNDLATVVIESAETGEKWYPGPVDALNLGRYQVKIPYAATKYDGLLRSFWSYTINGEPVEAEEDIEVVTPYVSIDEIVEEYPELHDKSYEELRAMERRVRLIINKITGQEFGTRKKTVEGVLSPSNTLTLSDRLYHVHYFEMDGHRGHTHELDIKNDGYMVQVTFPPGYYHVKSDTFWNRREPRTTVVLHGNFGWPVVPNDINVAAKMLVGDYFCNDNTYRQRGVEAIRAADWRIEFHDSAFKGTGNLDVDILLSKYAAYNMVVI